MGRGMGCGERRSVMTRHLESRTPVFSEQDVLQACREVVETECSTLWASDPDLAAVVCSWVNNVGTHLFLKRACAAAGIPVGEMEDEL
jgi:hypothetical protein